MKTTSLAEAVIITTSFAACSGAATLCPRPCKWFDLLTLKVVSESPVTWAISVPILVFLGLSVLDLGPMYATDRQTDVRRASALNAPQGGGIIRRTLSTLVAELVSAGWMTMIALSGCYCLAEGRPLKFSSVYRGVCYFKDKPVHVFSVTVW